MTRLTDRPPAKPKGDLGGYVLTAFVVLSFAGLMIAATWRIAQHGVVALKPPQDPIGWGPGWDCVGAGAKSGGFCVRRSPTKPPSEHPSPLIPAKAETRP